MKTLAGRRSGSSVRRLNTVTNSTPNYRSDIPQGNPSQVAPELRGSNGVWRYPPHEPPESARSSCFQRTMPRGREVATELTNSAAKPGKNATDHAPKL